MKHISDPGSRDLWRSAVAIYLDNFEISKAHEYENAANQNLLTSFYLSAFSCKDDNRSGFLKTVFCSECYTTEKGQESTKFTPPSAKNLRTKPVFFEVNATRSYTLSSDIKSLSLFEKLKHLYGTGSSELFCVYLAYVRTEGVFIRTSSISAVQDRKCPDFTQ